MTLQSKDAQLKTMLMLTLISISLSDYQIMNNNAKISFTNLVLEDLMNFLPLKLKKISEILFKEFG